MHNNLNIFNTTNFTLKMVKMVFYYNKKNVGENYRLSGLLSNSTRGETFVFWGRDGEEAVKELVKALLPKS